MTPTQRHQLGSTLYTLGLALKGGRWTDAELAPLVERAKRGVDELYGDVCDKRDQAQRDKVAAEIEQHISAIERLAKPAHVPTPDFKPHYTEPVCGDNNRTANDNEIDSLKQKTVCLPAPRKITQPQGFNALFAGAGRGMEMSLPNGDRG